MEAHGNGIESSVEVELRGLSIYTHHGVSDAEQEIGQRLEFDISFDVPDCDAVLTDRLEDTVDYAEVCDIVALAATERSYRTLERLAQVVGERLIERYGCESVRVRAAKPEPPLPLAIQEVAVEVTHERALDERRGRGRSELSERRAELGYLGLGSNVGDREATCAPRSSCCATTASRSRPSPPPTRPSPSGRSSTSPTSSTPRSGSAPRSSPRPCSTLCKAIEAERGRELDGPATARARSTSTCSCSATSSWRPTASPCRTREVHSRRFVLAPLLELDPELTLPDGTRPRRRPSPLSRTTSSAPSVAPPLA